MNIEPVYKIESLVYRLKIEQCGKYEGQYYVQALTVVGFIVNENGIIAYRCNIHDDVCEDVLPKYLFRSNCDAKLRCCNRNRFIIDSKRECFSKIDYE